MGTTHHNVERSGQHNTHEQTNGQLTTPRTIKTKKQTRDVDTTRKKEEGHGARTEMEDVDMQMDNETDHKTR